MQVKTSKTQIPINAKNFEGLTNVSEYENDGELIYTVGQGKTLEEMYPLYSQVKVKGYKAAKVVAIKNKKIVKDKSRKQGISESTTHLYGKILSDNNLVTNTDIVVEDLSTGHVLRVDRCKDGNFSLDLKNGKIYGYYGKKDHYFSISNFIDLRNEVRNLELMKDIDLLTLDELKTDSAAFRINNLFFHTDEFNIASESYPELKRLASLINDLNLQTEIAGHTDNVGDEIYNNLLSQKRADSVKEFLLKMGCAKDQLTSKGYGFSKPIVDNTTEKGRYLNRRVEIKFMQ